MFEVGILNWEESQSDLYFDLAHWQISTQPTDLNKGGKAVTFLFSLHTRQVAPVTLLPNA